MKGDAKMQLGNNIYNLRKENGLSQEKLAEQINVTRQTISNWELGVTSPNPEQLILLSKVLNKSIDELVGNEVEFTKSKENDESIKNLYIGLAIICGSIAGIWSFSANRFRYIEMIFFVGIGMVIGVCLGVVCHSILRYVKSKEIIS